MKLNQNVARIRKLSIRSMGLLPTETCKFIENPEDYTDKPEYPEILDLSYEAKRQRKLQAYYEEFKNVGTIEEKIIKINLPKYYGFKSLILSQKRLPYDCLDFAKYSTRTDFKEVDKLPKFYEAQEEAAKKIVEQLKSEVQDIIGFEYAEREKLLKELKVEAADEREKIIAGNITQQLNRLLIVKLQQNYQHLSEVEVDLNPRHEAFWLVGGIDPPKSVRKQRLGKEWTKKYENDPVNRYFQYIGTPYLALRHQNLLKPFVEVDLETQNAAEENIEIPRQKYDPRTIGFHTEHRHGVTIPGYWPGNPNEFGLLSYQQRDGLIKRELVYEPADQQDALHANGLLSNFGWLFGQASYQGFTTYNEITYPLSAQTIITDGKKFSFYAYQMNTVLLFGDHAVNGPRYNQCWGLKEQNLFEEVDDTGKVTGFNEAVLQNLVHFYINAPEQRAIDLKPYLDENCSRVGLIEDEKRRDWLENIFKHLVSYRKRHLRVPETYLWEKIYKIDHKTRPMDKRLRPFELGINPFQRRLDDHTPVYVPRQFRPGGYGNRRKKSKAKWAPTYYPLGAKGKTPTVPNYPWVPLTN